MTNLCNNPIEDIFDACVIEKNGWLLYGSKKPEGEPYVVTSVLKYENGEMAEVNNL